MPSSALLLLVLISAQCPRDVVLHVPDEVPADALQRIVTGLRLPMCVIPLKAVGSSREAHREAQRVLREARRAKLVGTHAQATGSMSPGRVWVELALGKGGLPA